jgi:hypothetical protein
VMLLVSSVQFHAIIDAMPSTHNREDLQMTHITYEIVEHDGVWAYRVDGVVSESASITFEATSAFTFITAR